MQYQKKEELENSLIENIWSEEQNEKKNREKQTELQRPVGLPQT